MFTKMKNIVLMFLWSAVFSGQAVALSIHCEKSPKQYFYDSLIKLEADEHEGMFEIVITAPTQIENEEYTNSSFYKENGDSLLVLPVSSKLLKGEVRIWMMATKDELKGSHLSVFYGEKSCPITIILDLEHNKALKSDAAKSGAP
jgi:hypothetical protein